MKSEVKMTSERQIRVEIDGRNLAVPFDHYAKAKWKQLREFGYSDLTLDDAKNQLELVLSGEKEIGKGKLSIIGKFIETDKPTKIQ